MTKKKKIIAPYGVLSEVAKLFKTSLRTVYSAANFKTQSKFSDKIRAAVLERGGEIYESTKEK
ncbi:MAG: hypothetical protein H6Q15_2169 [Bacteroidetes bacterium]|nr:hypothetical protein [Bacteroidota bacterium]